MDEIGPQSFGPGEMLLVPGQLMLPAGRWPAMPS